MLDKTTLRANARARLEDAQLLFDNKRYDGSAYLCGYAVEFALKARICETLNTTSYPDNIAKYKTHNLAILLSFTGIEIQLKQTAPAEWFFVVQNWQPEMRYRASGTVLLSDAQELLRATRTLLQIL